jgi:hypothetical protein
MNDEESHDNKQSDRDIHREREIVRCNIECSTIVQDQNYDYYIEENLWTEDNYHRINNSIITFTDEAAESAIGALQHTLK